CSPAASAGRTNTTTASGTSPPASATLRSSQPPCAGPDFAGATATTTGKSRPVSRKYAAGSATTGGTARCQPGAGAGRQVNGRPCLAWPFSHLSSALGGRAVTCAARTSSSSADQDG